MRIKTCLALALAGAVSMSAAVATSLLPTNLNEVAKEASVAIVGKVISSRTVQSAGVVTTVNTLAVETNMWGANGAATVNVEVPGGQFKNGKYNLAVRYPGAKMMANGERVILMLKSAPGSDNLQIVGFNYGVFQVVPSAQGDEVMLPGASQLMPIADAMRAINEARSSENSNNGLR